jgi:hypothetical protein
MEPRLERGHRANDPFPMRTVVVVLCLLRVEGQRQTGA